MDLEIKKSESIDIFKSNILKSIRPKRNSVFYCYNSKRIRLMTRLRFGLCYLRKHFRLVLPSKFKHRFQGCSDRDCFYCNGHFTILLSYLYKRNERMTLLDKTKSIHCGILELSGAVVTKILRVWYNSLSEIWFFGGNILFFVGNILIKITLIIKLLRLNM